MYLKDEKEKFMQYNSSWDLNRASTYIYAKTFTENITASGFFLTFNNVSSVFLVTNRHVAINAETFVISLYSSIEEDSLGSIANVSDKVIFHPQDNIDLCLIKIDNLVLFPNNMTFDSVQIQSIHESMIVSQQDAAQLNYCEDIIMFGAPHGIYDTKNNLSIAYKGMTATHAGTECFGEPYFMVDLPSWPGSSGSAIYLCNHETMRNFENTKLLGIFYEAQYNPHSAPKNKEYIHLGKAISAYKLLEFKKIL